MLIASLVLVEKLPLTSGLHHQGRYGVIVMSLSNRENKDNKNAELIRDHKILQGEEK